MRLLRLVVFGACLAALSVGCGRSAGLTDPVDAGGNVRPRNTGSKNGPCVIVVEVQDGTIFAPRTVTCSQDGSASIVFINYDDGEYTIRIDPTEIYDKANPGSKKNPFNSSGMLQQKLKKDVEVVKAHIDPRADTSVTYKYTIHCDGCAHPTQDPDIEIMM